MKTVFRETLKVDDEFSTVSSATEPYYRVVAIGDSLIHAVALHNPDVADTLVKVGTCYVPERQTTKGGVDWRAKAVKRKREIRALNKRVQHYKALSHFNSQEAREWRTVAAQAQNRVRDLEAKLIAIHAASDT